MGRNGAKGISRCILFLLANDCFECLRATGVSERVAYRGVLRDLHLGGILQVEASAECCCSC